MNAFIEQYAALLIDYCLAIKPGDKLYVTSTLLAEPLVREVYRLGIRRGAHVEIKLSFEEQEKIYLTEAGEEQLAWVNPNHLSIMESYDAYLAIRAPYNLREDQNNPPEKSKRRQEALKPLNDVYFRRIGDGSMRRCLCQYPTPASAQEAGMSTEEYRQFVLKACRLDESDAPGAWLAVRKQQQRVVDYLNGRKLIRYVNTGTDLSFSVAGRTWINSDGRANMPSGEVFTAPVEDSVEGHVHFTYPAIYMGHEVENIRLRVKAGYIEHWEATRGQEFLDYIFSIPGTRYFGEVAIGTNYQIQQITKNILFDEKIGGSIHLAIGQSYYQCGGKNQSSVHWDMISDMRAGGQIYADGELIYADGVFRGPLA